jgi:uncharacterized membrane protein YkvA (DUF1232 family)
MEEHFKKMSGKVILKGGKRVSEDQIKEFYENLKKQLQGYDEEFKEVIKHTPDVFQLLSDLRFDPKVPPESIDVITASLAYFMSPDDAIPEDRTGKWGFLDDLFLCSLALKKLEKEVGYETLAKYWKGKGELKNVVKEILGTGSEWLVGMEKEIIKQAGLNPKDFKGVKIN